MGKLRKDFQFIESQEPKPSMIILCPTHNRFQRAEEEAGYSALRLDKASLDQGKEGREGH